MEDLPRTLEQILARAAADPLFREALLADRLAAVEERGHRLTPSERNILLAVPADQLGAMVDHLASGVVDVTEPPVYACQGIRPEMSAGISPTRGIRPDSPVKGIRPGCVLLTAAAATVAAAGAVGIWGLSAGVRPDYQPPASESVLGETDTRAPTGAADAGPPPDLDREEPAQK